jgi:hypothetical protein
MALFYRRWRLGLRLPFSHVASRLEAVHHPMSSYAHKRRSHIHLVFHLCKWQGQVGLAGDTLRLLPPDLREHRQGDW